MCNVALAEGLSREHAGRVCLWSNRRGAGFLAQWAGMEVAFPLTVETLRRFDNVYSIFSSDEFVGIIQKLHGEGGDVHIGRFLIDPSRTGRGIGGCALSEFVRMLFANPGVGSISLSVFADNVAAKGLYERLGFKVCEAIDQPRRRFLMRLARGASVAPVSKRHACLETERLLLRPWLESDAKDLFLYASDPLVGPMAGWPAHTCIEDSLGAIRGVLSAPESYAVVPKSAGHAVGSIGLKTDNGASIKLAGDECELGYWIGVPFWGQGLIPEAVRELQRHAFEDLGMGTMWVGYFDGNEKSRRVQEKCGFAYHHTAHDVACAMPDVLHTEHFSSMTREAWLSRHAGTRT